MRATILSLSKPTLAHSTAWKRLDEFNDETPLYPEGLRDLLLAHSR